MGQAWPCDRPYALMGTLTRGVRSVALTIWCERSTHKNSLMSMQRVLLPADPGPGDQSLVSPWSAGDWRAKWINHPAQGPGVAGVALFRRRFTWPGGQLGLHLSADQRFRVYLDGEDLGGGPERGDVSHWRYHSWSGELPAGEHELLARVWWLAEPPHAQCSLRPAFLCAADGAAADLFNTGEAPWEVCLEDCWEAIGAAMCWGVGSRVRLRLDASHPGIAGADAIWCTPAVQRPAVHAGQGGANRGGRLRLVPARLPTQHERRGAGGQVVLVVDAGDLSPAALALRPLDPAEQLVAEAARWQALLDGQGLVTLPAGVRRRALIDLGVYRCAYPEVSLAGRGLLRVAWAEACFTHPQHESKGRRDQWQGLYLRGVADEFVAVADAPHRGTTLWWKSGRFVELVVEATTQPLCIHDLGWRDTGYPLSEDGRFTCSDPALLASLAVMQRTLQRCAHETFMDCPYYEQMQYAGDTRLECQVLRALSRDHRLCVQAVDAFAHSLRDQGLLSSRWPTWEWQDIPTFSLLWIGMLHDALMWGSDPSVVRRHLGAMRAVLERFRTHLRADGLLGWVDGWNFVDWVPGWPAGEIPGERGGGGAAPTSWLLAYAARLAADIEDWAGEPALAMRNRTLAQSLAQSCGRLLWDEAAGCFVDMVGTKTYSEHAQLLALLAGVDPARQSRLITALGRSRVGPVTGTGYDFSPATLAAAGLSYADPMHMAQPTVYFSHYRFEVAAQFRQPALLFDRLDYWRGLAGHGFTTVPEMPEPSRSDCHAWGAHPRFHAAATILGIRPAAPLFEAVRITPMLGSMSSAAGTWPHPRGDITVSLHRSDDGLHGTIELPPGLPGVLVRENHPDQAVRERFRW